MQRSTQHQNSEENAQELARARGKYRTLFIVKCLLGILLLVLGGVAVKNTSGQPDTFGPPYFLGAFIVGCAMILAGVVNIIMYRFFVSSDSATIQKLTKYTFVEVLLTGIAIVSGFIGIFFVSAYGIPECDPSDFFSNCNYTKNLSTNRSLAIAILISLLVSELISVWSIVMNCRTCKGLGPFTRQHRFTTHQNHYNVGDPGAGAHPPHNTAILPPVGCPQYSDTASQNTQYKNEGQCHNSDESINHLQEQNRLLREQIALQQQRLQLMQQQQQQDVPSSSPLPPPPSYESCLQDQAQMKFLQEQNEELQNRYQIQQQQITEKIPFTGDRNITPSAPPM